MAGSKKETSLDAATSGAGREVGKVVAFRALPRRRLDIDESDHVSLEAVSARFGLPKSEVVRRLIRAANDLGPALSRENAVVVGELAREVRAVGRTLNQLLLATRRGETSSIEGAEAVISRLVESYAAINAELTAMILAYGSRVRESVNAHRDAP